MFGKGLGVRMEPQDRIMDGDLQTLGLQSVLKMLALSEKTGTLIVSSGPEILSINLWQGRIIGLREEGAPQPDILAMFSLINRIDPRNVQRLREQAGYSMQAQLAKLVELNWMSVSEAQQRLEFAVTQSISHALHWANGRFAFHRQVLSMEMRIQPLDIDSVLLESLRQADEWEKMRETHLTRTTMVRWLQEVHRDVRSLGLDREAIEILCLSNGEIPLQAMSLALKLPEARVGRVIARLLDLRLIEVVDTDLEAEQERDLSNLLIKCQSKLAKNQQTPRQEQRLLGMIEILSICVNGLYAHHGMFAKALRGRGQLSQTDVSQFIEQKFAPQFLLLSRQYPILETVEFRDGQIDCTSILTLDQLVRGEQLSEFYWEAIIGLAAYVRMVFQELLNEEFGSSRTGYNLNLVWKAFLTELDTDIQHYQVLRAQRAVQSARTGSLAYVPPSPPDIRQQRSDMPEHPTGAYWAQGSQRW